MMNNRELVIRDMPVSLWILGLGFLGMGGFFLCSGNAPVVLAGLFILGGAALVLFFPIVTVWVDRGARKMVIDKLSLTGKRSQEVQVEKVSSVYVDQRYSSSQGRTSSTYRVVIVLDDGQEMLLRKPSSSNRRKKLQQADAIRRAIGVGGKDESPLSIGAALGQMVSLIPALDQEEKTGIAPGEQETNGVRWQLETLHFGGAEGGSPLYRWHSNDFNIPGDFLYLAQRMEGVGKQKGLMSLAGNLLVKSSMRIYGFDESFTPGVDDAVPVEGVDRRLDDHFVIRTSNPAEARQVLNTWVVMPLVGWADRYALRKHDRQVHQLAVLVSPQGVYVSVLNRLDAAQVDELVGLGVELVRAMQS